MAPPPSSIVPRTSRALVVIALTTAVSVPARTSPQRPPALQTPSHTARLAPPTPPASSSGDSGTIRIHLLGHAIGSERYVMRDSAQRRVVADTFAFTDRGGRVQLLSSMQLSHNFEPIQLRAHGQTYRFVNVDADVTISRDTVHVASAGDTSIIALPRVFFAIAGYAPLHTQALLIRYWQSHGRPARIATAPANPLAFVTIADLGVARVRFTDRDTITLRRYSVDGVAWGREIVYLDNTSHFAALVTRANLLPLEGIREDLAARYPALHDSIVVDAARAGIASMTRASPSAIATGTYAVVGARVVDGTSHAPIDDGIIIVRDGRIASVGTRAQMAVPSGMRVINAMGKTIIPGLWDMHAHMALAEWGPAYLGVGVTTARDMGGEQSFLTAFRDATATQRVPGPRILLAGLVDGSGADAFGTTYADTPEQGRAVVDAYHAAGFQQMKLYTLIKPDVAAAIITRAHELSMTVTGHVPRSMTLATWVDAGADNVAHLPVRGDTASMAVKQQIAMLAAKRVAIDPTASWGELLGHSGQTPLTEFQPGFAEAPWPLLASYGSVRNTTDSATANRSVRAQLAVVKAMHDAGVRIVAGTDYGLPGFSLLRELELYVSAGLSPLEAI